MYSVQRWDEIRYKGIFSKSSHKLIVLKFHTSPAIMNVIIRFFSGFGVHFAVRENMAGITRPCKAPCVILITVNAGVSKFTVINGRMKFKTEHSRRPIPNTYFPP